MCVCVRGLGNLGVGNCKELLQYEAGSFLVPKYGSDGSLNRIDLANDTINDAYIIAKINAPDPRDRWYPMPLFSEFTPTIADTVFQELNTGEKIFVREGVQSISQLLHAQASQMLGKLKDNRCTEFGKYSITNDSALVGDIFEEGFLSPIPIANQTWNPVFQPATPTTASGILLTYDLSLTHKDEYMAYITAASVAPVNFLTYKGLLDVYVKFISVGQTSAVLQLYTSYGDVLNPDTVDSLVAADFVDDADATSKFENTTDAASVSITTVTESTEGGTYTIVYASQTVGDKLKFRCKKNGFDFSPMAEKLGTVA